MISANVRRNFKSCSTGTESKILRRINKIINYAPYTIIASAIQKDRFIDEFGKLQDDLYEVALSFVVEQATMALKSSGEATTLFIIIEKRGKKEDKQLDDHFKEYWARVQAN